MIQLSSVALYRGGHCLFEDGDVMIHPGFKVGLTGRNGAGKSSVFALIRGELATEKGECRVPDDAVVAHVAQETPALECSALDYVLQGDQALVGAREAIERAEQAGDGESIAKAYAQLELVDGYTADSRGSALLHGLGFKQDELNKPVRAFSGGWRVRLNVAQALMCPSDILLLDEPTNHLDLDSVVWLEQWLKHYTGTLVLISHDRAFLDSVVSHVVHIEHKQLTLYKGNYSQFERVRAEQLALQQKMYVKQQQQRAHMEHFVERFRAKATKAKQAQSRIKALERMADIAPAHVDSPFEFQFREPDRLPFSLVQMDSAQLGYGDTAVLRDVKFQLSPGDRIGLLGANGAGKSTLIKALAGELTVQAGRYQRAEGLNVGYFAQHQVEQLDSGASPITHIQRLTPGESERSIRSFIGGFGFGNEKLTAPVGQFSGGEKSRLVLAMLVWQRPQVLLLDEPTNHLDLEMRHALNVALQFFTGAMVIVSHDRHLLQTVCEQFYRVHDGVVDEYNDSMDAYQAWLIAQRKIDNGASNDGANDDPSLSSERSSAQRVDKKAERQANAQSRQAVSALKKQIAQAEAAIERLDGQLKVLDDALADPALYDSGADASEVVRLNQEKNNILEEKLQIESQWMEWMDALDSHE